MRQTLLKPLRLRATLLVALFCMVCTHVWGQVSTATATDGKEYVVAYYVNSKYYALPHGTSAGVWNGTEVTLNSINKVSTTTAATLAWKLTKKSGEDGKFYMTYTSGSSTYYLYKNGTTKSSNYNIKGTTTSSEQHYWEYTLSSDNKSYTVKSLKGGTGEATSLYLGYAIAGKYGVYASTNAAKIILLEIGDEPINITSISFADPKSSTIGYGETLTLAPTITPANYTETVDWKSDDTSVATVSSTGVVTGTGAGVAHITAKAHSNPTTYDTYTVTVNAPVAVTGISLNKTATTLLVGSTETLEATITPADASNKNIVWTSSDETKVSVDAGLIKALALTDGTPVTITATTEDGSFSATCAVTVDPVPVVVTATDVTMTYGDAAKAIGATTSTGYAGALSYTSANPEVATVDATSGKVTAVAVGTTTITISSTADLENFFAAGEDKVINVTVNAPEGKETVQASSTATLDFTDNTEWKIPTVTTKDEGTYSDGTYSVTLKYGEAGNGYRFYSRTSSGTQLTSLLMGTKGSTLTFQQFDKFVTQIDITGCSDASKNVTQNIFVGDEEVSTQTTGCKSKNEYAIAEAYQAPGNIYTLKVTSSDNTQITKIVIHFKETVSDKVSLNAKGYATYCSENPLDFSGYETADYSAWQITDISGETITFEQITKAIKGGQGILLKGEANADLELPCANSTKVLSANKLVGTLAPTYFDIDEIYGLAGNVFMHNNAGTIKANKAYIPSSAVDGGVSDIRAYTFVFVDTTTGIAETQRVSAEEAEAIFNLAGQRRGGLQRGVNIVGGKKVLVK